MGQPLRHLILGSSPVELDASGNPPTRFRIAAFGKNETSKGAFELRREDAVAMVERAKTRKLKLSADYEHAAVHAQMKGTKAPAAGWFDLDLGDDGLYAANIEWTEDALLHLKKKEYRYWSPWFGQRDDGSVGSFKNFALTNRPAMDALTPLVASEDDAESTDLTPEKPKMKTLLKSLALTEDATEAEALTKLNSVFAERDAFFTATGTKDIPGALATVETWKKDASRAKELQAEVDSIKGAAAKKEHELLLAEGVRTGKIPPVMKDFWASQGIDVLKDYLEKAPVADATRAGEKPVQKDPKDADITLTDEDKQVAKAMNIEESKFAAHKKSMLTTGQV